MDGKWEATIESPTGPMTMTFDLKADGEMLSGAVANEMMGKSEIADGKIEGDKVSFVQVMQRGEREIRFKYEGTVSATQWSLPVRWSALPAEPPVNRAEAPAERAAAAKGRGAETAAPEAADSRAAAVKAKAETAAAWAAP